MRATIRNGAIAAVYLLGVMAPLAGANGMFEYDAVVYELTDDGSRGRRVHRDAFLREPSEKRAASFNRCGVDFFHSRDKVDKLLALSSAGHRVIMYESTVDPVSKNTRRRVVCEFDS